MDEMNTNPEAEVETPVEAPVMEGEEVTTEAEAPVEGTEGEEEAA